MDQSHGFYRITLQSLPVAKVGVDNSKLLFNSKLTYVAYKMMMINDLHIYKYIYRTILSEKKL